MKTFLYLFIFTFCTSVYSQDSLMQYLEIAARNNPLMLQRYAEYEAALQKVPQVGSLPDPELTAGVFLSPMELLGGKQVAEIQLMQMFPWFGVLKNAKDEMSLMAKAKYESFEDTKLQVFFELQRTWYELQKVQQNIRIAEKNIDILRTLERLSLVKFKAPPSSGNSSSSVNTSSAVNSSLSSSSGKSGMGGMGVNTGNTNQSVPSGSQSSAMGGGTMGTSSTNGGLADLYRIQIEISDMDNTIALLKSQQNTVSARFNSYLNRPAQSTVWLPDTLVVSSLGLPILSISDSMLNNNPMLGMLQYEQQSYDARKKMVSRMGYPMIGAGINYSLINKDPMSSSAMNGNDMIMPMIRITLPIYRKKYKTMQKESELMQSASKSSYQSTANALQTEYYEAVQFYHDGERRITLYHSQSLLAKRSLDIMVKSFAVSSSGLSDVLRVRQQLLDYETKRIEAIADYNTAVAWLKRLGALQP